MNGNRLKSVERLPIGDAAKDRLDENNSRESVNAEVLLEILNELKLIRAVLEKQNVIPR